MPPFPTIVVGLAWYWWALIVLLVAILLRAISAYFNSTMTCREAIETARRLAGQGDVEAAMITLRIAHQHLSGQPTSDPGGRGADLERLSRALRALMADPAAFSQGFPDDLRHDIQPATPGDVNVCRRDDTISRLERVLADLPHQRSARGRWPSVGSTCCCCCRTSTENKGTNGGNLNS